MFLGLFRRKPDGRPQKRKRLGELLVEHKLLTQEQLGEALGVQKLTREPLGRILVRQGAISVLHLYQKLAEQWLMKASAASLTVAFGVASMGSSPAMAETTSIRLAPVAAIVAQPPETRRQADGYSSELFGTSEMRSDNIAAFTKWTTMLDRFDSQLSARSASPRVQLWKAALQDFRGKGSVAEIRAVNSYINEVKYIADKSNWGKSDYWATPMEFFSRGGDCEDFAIAKYASLKALGFTEDQMRIAIVHDKVKNIPHAILVVYTEDGTFVLDNQDKELKRTEDVKRYRPIFSINRSAWWLHKA